jgi:predicted dehydrogenase
MDSVGIGIVGLGNISGAYLKAAKNFPILDIRAVADLNPDAAKAAADAHGLKAVPLDDIFTNPEVEILLNLTIPRAHVDVGLRAIAAGKHVYSEKPLGVEFAQGKKLIEAAKAKGLRVGSAPDTFLGGAHQSARNLVDTGVLGTAVGGTAYFMCPGHERWHPNPASTTTSAAGRCSTWAPITSPTSSTCSGLSPRWPALRRRRRRPAPSPPRSAPAR